AERRTRRRRRWPWAAGAVALVAVAGLAFAFFAWPHGALDLDGVALARVRRPGFGTAGVGGSARRRDGVAIPAVLHRDGAIWPARPVAPGTRMLVTVVFRRPGWVGWAAGRTQRLQLELVAPVAGVEERWLRVRRGASVSVRFDRPVSEVEVTGAGTPQL